MAKDYYEVLGVSKTASQDGIIVDEVQKGYKINNEVIRTSKVVVGKKGE